MTASLMRPWRRSSTTALPLGVEQLAPQPLVVLRALLDLAVVLVVEACSEAAGAEAVGAAHALGRVLAHPVLAGELLETPERGLGGMDARLGLLLVGDAVVLEPQQRGSRPGA